MEDQNNELTFALELDEETAQKFSQLLNDDSLMHAGFVAHQSNNMLMTLNDEEKQAA